MKQNDNASEPDPRQILKDIAASEARKASGDKQGQETGQDDGKAKMDKNEAEAQSFISIIKGEANEGDRTFTSELTLGKILGGDILNTNFIRRQIWVVVLISFFIIVYISNRYSCQQDLIKIDKLTHELQDAKYRALSSSSDLTEQCRESKVLEKLKNNKDSVLHIATQPPYKIEVPQNSTE